MSNYLPLSVPSLKGKEWEYVKECLDMEWVSSAGEYVYEFEKKISEYTGAEHAIACVNGTSALQVSLRLAGVLPGDEVIVPTLTFVATINAVQYNTAKPIFMDADEYYNINAEKTIEYINSRTEFKNGYTINKNTRKKISAILPVHVWGNAAWLDELVPLCEERNISVVEDATESLGTRYNSGRFSGKHTGTVGRLGCLSFNGNKIITTGGGGMIITDDEKLAEKARYLTTQAKDDPNLYIHNEIGYNFRLTNIQAALGVAQLEQMSEFLQRKKDINQKYVDGVRKIDGLTMAEVPDYADNNQWMNLLKIDRGDYSMGWKELMTQLEDKSIETRPVWTLNHSQKPYKNCNNYKIEKAQKLVDSSLCLPSSTNLKKRQIQKVIDSLNG